MNHDHTISALLGSYFLALSTWFTQSHILGLLTGIYTLICIVIGIIKLSRMLKGGM